jgi:hypothetical protein
MLTMLPPPALAIAGITGLHVRKVPRAFTAKTRSQISREVSGARVVLPMPATLNRW